MMPPPMGSSSNRSGRTFSRRERIRRRVRGILYAAPVYGEISRERGGDTMNHTPNPSIRCSVTNCAHHCQEEQYCALDAIQVGTHESNPTVVECVDCESFRLR